MIYLVNRNAASRVECLHALTKHIMNDRRISSGFSTTQELKVQASGGRITDRCSLLIRDEALGISYCPYKENALDLGVCQLTNSTAHDSTQSKESSNSLNSLVALGLIWQDASKRYLLTSDGISFASSDLGDLEFTRVLFKGVMNYGPTVGLLGQFINNPDLLAAPIRASVGYPNTIERVQVNSRLVNLPVGSKPDSNVRTLSVLLKWLVAAGCIEPISEKKKQGGPAMAYRSFLNSPHRRTSKYRIMDEAQHYLLSKPTIQRPLDYMNLLKSLSLRERNQETERNALLEYATIVRNRRALIGLMLSAASRDNQDLSTQQILMEMDKNSEMFFIRGNRSEEIVANELQIGFSLGLPYIQERDCRVRSSTILNSSALMSTASDEVRAIMKSYV